MRFTKILATFLAFIFLAAGTAGTDELSDLKEQVTKLMERIIELEKKQKEQEKSVAKIKKAPSAAEVVSSALGEKVNMGAHLKLFLADRSDGERNDRDQNNNLSAGIDDLYLYFRKSITDWMTIDVAPKIDVVASATPRLGGDITRSSSVSTDIELDEAYITLRAPYPYDVELKAGAFYPLFSEEYGTKSWWHEQYHGNNGLLTLQHWQSTGIEIYKNFDFENFSLPVYFYPYLNGEDRTRDSFSRFTDNNGDKNILLHAAPEFFAYGARFRIPVSLGWGQWDSDGENDSFQYAVGANMTHGSISLSGEYLRRERENIPLLGGGETDGEDEGFYLKGIYSFTPKWRMLLKYSDVDLFLPGTVDLLTDNYKTISFAVDYWIVQDSTIIPQVEYVDAERSDNSEELTYWRWTLGWRTTF